MIKIFITILVFILTVSCSKDKKIVETSYSVSDSKSIPDNMIWDMDITITNSGKIKSRIKAGYLEREVIGKSKYTESYIDSGLIIEFYEENKKSGILTSDRGIMNDLKEVYSAIDNVKFDSDKGYVLYTDTLIWNRKKAEVSTDCAVMFIRDERDTLYGDGFKTDDRFLAYKVINPRGEAYIEKEIGKKE